MVKNLNRGSFRDTFCLGGYVYYYNNRAIRLRRILKMAVHTKIRKIFDDQVTCIYELSSDLVHTHCFAKINKKEDMIPFYTQKIYENPIFTYQLNSNEDQLMPTDKEYKLLIIHGLQKLIPTLTSKNFPLFLDKCS